VAFWPEMFFWLEMCVFSNESALLLKVLKGLARLWWLKAFRLVFFYFFRKQKHVLLFRKSELFRSKTFQHLIDLGLRESSQNSDNFYFLTPRVTNWI
jgi:hypothetical protein